MAATTFATGLSTGLIGGTAGLSSKDPKRLVQKFEYDISTFTGTTGQAINLMNIPAMTQIDFLQVIIKTALTTTGTPSFSVGDIANSTLYVSAYSTQTANSVATQAVTTNPLKFYATADKLALTLTGSSTFPGTGVLRFVVGMTDCTVDSPMTTQS